MGYKYFNNKDCCCNSYDDDCYCTYCDLKAYRKHINTFKKWSSQLAVAVGSPAPKRCACANLDKPDCDCPVYKYKKYNCCC